MARGYAFAKIEHVSIRMYLSKIEYAYDEFRTEFTYRPTRIVTIVWKAGST